MRLFWKFSHRQHATKVACVATLALVMRQLKKSREIQRAELFATKYKLVASPVRGWLHMPFSLRTGKATVSKNRLTIASKKSGSCSHGFIYGIILFLAHVYITLRCPFPLMVWARSNHWQLRVVFETAMRKQIWMKDTVGQSKKSQNKTK